MKLFWKTGEPYVLATGAALAVILVMTLTLVGTVMTNGLGYFWPRELVRFELKDGSFALGQITQQEKNPIDGSRRPMRCCWNAASMATISVFYTALARKGSR
jgi:phosphate transport system permease protein